MINDPPKEKKRKINKFALLIPLILFLFILYSLFPYVLRLKYNLFPEQETRKFENIIRKCEQDVVEKYSVEKSDKDELTVGTTEYMDLVEECVNSKNRSPKFHLDYDGSDF